jgi:hypothetical protein
MEIPPKDVVPVHANMETATKWGSGQAASSSTFMRDEKSRTRVEHGDIASVNDPAAGKSFLLHMPKKIAIPQVPQPPMLPPKPKIAAPTPPGAAPAALPQPPEFKESADLGKKMIDGMMAHGKEYTAAIPGKPQPMSIQVWTADDLKLPIQSTVKDPSTGTTTVTQMKNVVPGAKIDPAKFQIPADFKTVQPPPAPPLPLKA